MTDAPDDRILGLSLRTLVDSLPFDVWVRDADDGLVYANEAARARWPVLLGQTAAQTPVAPEIAARWKENNARALAGELVRAEQVERGSGEERTVLALLAPVRDGAKGKVVGTVGMNVDTTSAHRARLEAESAGDLLQSIFATAPIAIGVRALRGEDLVHVVDNPVAAALWAATPEALAGKTDTQLGIDDVQVARAVARFREAKLTRAPVDFELHYPFPSGVHTFAGKVMALPTEEEELFVFVAADVTEVRFLRTGVERLERLASLGTLSAAIGHEIANPAAAALVEVEVALAAARETSSTGLVVEALADAREALLRVREVLDDMRRLAREGELAAESVVRDVLRGTLALLRHELRARVVVEEDVPPDLRVELAASRLGQVLHNLVRNATQAVLESGREGKVWVRARAEGERAIVEVEDEGVGIGTTPPGALFEPFFTTKTHGTGLGLYVCRLLVERAGGTIAARAREGGGLIVHVELPVAS